MPMYVDPTTGKLAYDTSQRISPEQYQQILDWQKQRSMGGNFATLGQMSTQTGMTADQINAANDYYMMDLYNSGKDGTFNSMTDWGNSLKNTGYSPSLGSLFGAPSIQTTSPIPMQSRPATTAQARPTTTRSAGTTSQVASTRGQMPQTAINPYNYNQVGQAVQSTSTPMVGGRRMTSQAANTGNTGSTGNIGSTSMYNQTGSNSVGGSAPTMGTGTQNTYNPTTYSNPDSSNGFINSSGGFAYDMLPGMMNYLMQYLGQGMNQSAGNSNAMNNFVNSSVTSGYPNGMSQYLQQMTGNTGTGQMNYGTGMQNAAATSANNLASGNTYQTDLQRQVGNTLSQLIGGSGLSDAYVSAMNQSVLQPGLMNLEGELNRMGGGVVAPTSGLQMELKGDMMSDFNNQMIKSGYENLSNFLNQATQSEGQNFNQTLNTANLQGNLGNQAINNSLNATEQGGNLLSNYLNAANQAQGNQNQYTLGLANQYGNLTSDYLRGYLADQAIKNQNKQASNSSLGSGLASILGSLLGGGGSSGSSGSGSGASGNLNNAWSAIKKLLGIGDDVPFPAPQNPDQPTGGGIGDIINGIPYQDTDLYNQLNDIMGGYGDYTAGDVNNFDWSSLLDQYGFSDTDTAVDWGNMFDTGSDNSYANDTISSQPSTYQYFYDNGLVDLGDYSWLYGLNY